MIKYTISNSKHREKDCHYLRMDDMGHDIAGVEPKSYY